MAFYRQQLHFREVEVKDLEMLRSWRNNPLMAAGWRDPRSVQTLEEQIRWYHTLSHKNQAFIAEDQGVVMGLLRFVLDAVVSEARITGIDVNPNCQSKGYGTRILRAGVEYVLNDLGYHRATGEAMEGNEAAIKIILSAGFTQEGTLRKYVWRRNGWQDWFIYSILQEELWKDETGVAAG